MGTKKEIAGLLPLRHLIGGNADELRNLERLRDAWAYFVGAGNGNLSHPISIRHGLLLIGCHDASMLEDFRKTMKMAWPELRKRIVSMLKTHLRRMEVVPSDPEPSSVLRTHEPPTEKLDPLGAVLGHYRRLNSNKG